MAAKSTVAVKFTGDIADLKKATGEAEQELGGFGSRVGPKMAAGMAGLGAAAGGALITGMQTKMERDKVQGKLSASLGLTPEEAKNLGKVSGEVYADGWGESFEEVSTGAAEVMSVLGDFADPEQLEPLTKKALDLAYIFEQDVATVINTTGFLLRNGLARDADEAFDVITAGLQRIPTELQGEALDALNEYSQSFGALGFDAQDTMELIVTAGQNTSVGIDKVGDSVKEFLIRATDGSEATVGALESIGLEAEGISNDLLAGGNTAETAFQKIIDGLLAMEDPSAQAQAAIALFGTPIEDLSVDKIPEFLEALGGMEDGFGDVEGASDEAAAQLDGDARKYQESMRKLETAQQVFVNRFVLGLEVIAEKSEASAKRMAVAIGFLPEIYEEALGRVGSAFNFPIRQAQRLIDWLDKIPGLADAANAAVDAIPGGPSENEEMSDYLAGLTGGTISGGTGGFLPGSRRIPIGHGGGTFHAPRPGGEGLAILQDGEHISVPGAGSGSDYGAAIVAAIERLRRDISATTVHLDGHPVGTMTRREADLHALRNAV